MKKYLTKVEYKKNNNKIIDYFMFNASSSFALADYRIRQHLTKKFEHYQLTDIHIMPLDNMEHITI